MWVLPPQELGDVDQALDTALTYVNGVAIYELSPAERAAIHAVYQLYEALSGQPHADLTPEVLNAARPPLYSAYDQVQIGGRLGSLRERILASTNQCPYCGFGEPRDLDHYLPRSVFGELAIYPRNLIPTCGPCNNAKRTVVPGIGAASGPSLIHAYFQNLPNVQFLRAEVTFEEGTLQVRYCIEDNVLDPALATKLQFQLDRLKLNDRYKGQVNKFLSEQRAAMLMFSEIGAALFAEYLERSATSLGTSFGQNDWRPALLRALSENPDFCSSPADYLGT
ncbi:HNH endonuclease [Ensifer adhaerens]|uniref:HNH endonuclease n=1 Tax=Ensifer adhaerens TaxID=106592 RepID=UPI001C4DE062|nr:HNH endonuclease signature motif containing protein [Ensifer adhaerens]MBW0368274.1 HNH endonuclease [Ensifer adhaerens]UCM24984.1 HNH endonuclease [Ensifer adhaerens]